MYNLKKNNKGITLIALIITIIVLLILAGVTIAAITSNESAPNKAVEARTENDRGAARDSATLLVADKIQDYYEGKYVGADEIARVSSTIRDYLQNENVLGATNGVTTGEFTVKVADGKITVKKGTGTNAILMATGTVDTSGVITWDSVPDEETTGGNNNTPVANTITIASEDSNHSVPAVGDVVAYDPGNLTTANIDLPEGAKIEGTKLASIADDLPSGASLNSEIDASEATEWVVLKTVTDSNENVTDVLIVPTTYDTDSLTLDGMDGYNNAIEALDTVAGIYLNPIYAKSARSLRVEDVNELEEYEPNGNETYAVFQNDYGMNDNLDIVENGGKTLTIETVSDGETIEISGKQYTSTAETGNYYYSLNTNILSNITYCWLASRCVDVNSNNCYFYVRYLNSGFVNSNDLFYVDSNGYYYSINSSYSVLPVVSLKSGIQMTWDSTNEKWTLE